jgi:hypothetical protein
MDDISQAYSLFIDVERSKAFLRDYEKDFMFSEVDEDGHNVDNDNNKKEETNKSENDKMNLD